MRMDWSRFDRDAAGRFRADLLDLVRERAGGDVALVATAVGQAIDRAGPAWRGSKITLVPEFSDSPYSDTYVNSVTVKVAGLPLTLFPSRLRHPDDVLEYGDREFFGRDIDADADYFTLVQELQTPNSTAKQAGKLLTLYTARPSKDRARLLRGKDLPAGVFLTSSLDRAVGLAEDLGGLRDVWKVRLYGSQVVRTLDAGRESEYQVVPTDSGVAPVAYLELLAEGVKVRNPAPSRTFVPPAAVAAEARLGLAIRAQQPPSQRCCTPVGLRRASQLANRQPVSVRTLKRMRSYFQRHAVDAKGARWDDPRNPSKGKVAWLIWGGDSGRKWCNDILDQLGE